MKTEILRKLQSRIDRRANDIAWFEQELLNYERHSVEGSYIALNELRVEQTLDKRLMGQLMRYNNLQVGYKKLLIKFSETVRRNVQLRDGLQMKWEEKE